MNYSVIETDLTYKQFKERFEKNIASNKYAKREPENPFYFGSIADGNIQVLCLLPYWRSLLNGLQGRVIEDEGKCTVFYKINLPLSIYKLGKVMIGFALISPIVLWLYLQFDFNIVHRFLSDSASFLEKIVIVTPFLMPAIIFIGIMLVNTKKEGENCIRKLEEIIADDIDKCEENLFERTRKIQAEVIMLDNFHNPKLLVCQETRADGVQIQYYKDKENECFIEKIGDFVTVEIDEAGESKYRILERK